MDSANESRGLKIAVSTFLTLAVILAVTSYFLYSNGSNAEARLDSERDAHHKAMRVAAAALSQYDEMRIRIGTKAVEFDAARAEISASFKSVDERLNKLINAVNVDSPVGPAKRERGGRSWKTPGSRCKSRSHRIATSQTRTISRRSIG